MDGEYADTIRARMRNDMSNTLDRLGTFDDPGLHVWSEMEKESLVLSLVEDGMHAVEQVIGRTLSD